MKNIYFICSLFVLMTICGCSKDDNIDSTIYFVGDSQIANWDTEFYFPNRITINLGKDGASLYYLDKVNNIKPESDVIIEIGTNDLQSDWDETKVDNFLDMFISVINSLPGRKKYILEIFPTSNLKKNIVIKLFNKRIKETVGSYKNLVIIEVYDNLEKDGVIKENLSRDGVHLNDYGYIVVTNQVKRII